MVNFNRWVGQNVGYGQQLSKFTRDLSAILAAGGASLAESRSLFSNDFFEEAFFNEPVNGAFPLPTPVSKTMPHALISASLSSLKLKTSFAAIREAADIAADAAVPVATMKQLADQGNYDACVECAVKALKGRLFRRVLCFITQMETMRMPSNISSWLKRIRLPPLFRKSPERSSSPRR